MHDITIFKHEVFGEIRVARNENDETLFCLSDVCKVIELSNPSSVKGRLDVDDVQLLDLHALNSNEGGIGNTMATFVTEAGLYDILLFSSSKKVKPFRKWVTREVLPSIRKHGAYMTDDVIQRTLTDPDYLIQLATVLKEEKQKRIQAETKVAILTHTNKTYTATEIAKEIGMRSAKELNKWLENMQVQYKVNETWVPCAKYANQAWFEIKQEEMDNGRIVYHRKITGLGREGIIDLFNKAQIA